MIKYHFLTIPGMLYIPNPTWALSQSHCPSLQCRAKCIPIVILVV